MALNNVTSAVMQLNLEDKLPVTFGMLTTENIDQALQRVDLQALNFCATIQVEKVLSKVRTNLRERESANDRKDG
ncbi:hypothetical protein FYJ61_09580 [Lactobacillus equicursoris]|uniref:Uncharacterized protein n=1 Tax=Lactobacillus equicursoris TaxID=420645 RepID=A0A844FPU0_9LACO|nr:hypothetical protein [Lactobacillus equicursoris]